jgi:hypothetical protein
MPRVLDAKLPRYTHLSSQVTKGYESLFAVGATLVVDGNKTVRVPT